MGWQSDHVIADHHHQRGTHGRHQTETQALFDQGLNLRREVLGTEYVDGLLARANDFHDGVSAITTEWC